jgi:glycosyltransferase involved in cell wall biosynthesis
LDDLPFISIIVAVKNGEKTLKRCIDSFSLQTYKKKELIIIDGNSNDSTIDIIKRNERNITFWESKEDTGVYQAWNNALDHVKGEWICFIGADDFFWKSEVLEQLAVCLKNAGPKTTLAYGRVALVDKYGKTLMTIGEPWEKLKKKFKQIMCLPHPGLMHHRSIFERHGKFKENFQIAGDYELLLRELIQRDPLFIPITVIGMQNGGLSTKPKNVIISMKEMRLAQRMNGINYPGAKWMSGYLAANVRFLLYKYLKSKP